MAEIGDNGKRSEIEQLFEAIARGVTSEVEELLDNGVPLESRDDMERTPLILAAEAGRVDVVQKLLDRGANVNASDIDHETALMAATFQDDLELVQFLVSRGADVSVLNSDASTALDIAKDLGFQAVATYLSDHYNKVLVQQAPNTSTKPVNEGATTDSSPVALAPVAVVESSGAQAHLPEFSSDLIHELGRSTFFKPQVADASVEQEPMPLRPPEAHSDQANAKDGVRIPVPSDNAANVRSSSIEDMASTVRKILFHTVEAGLDQVGRYLLLYVFDNDTQQVFSKKPSKGKASLSKIAEQPDMPLRRQQLADCVRVAALNQVFKDRYPELAELSFSHKAQIARLSDEDQRLDLARKALDHHLTVQSLRDKVKEIIGGIPSEDRRLGRTILRQVGEVIRLSTDQESAKFVKDKGRIKSALETADRLQMLRQTTDARKHVKKSIKLLRGLEKTLVEIELEDRT